MNAVIGKEVGQTTDGSKEITGNDNGETRLPQVLTVEEVAALLRLNRKTVYAAVKRGEIPGVRRVGGTIRVLRDAVVNWMAEGQPCVSRSSRSPR
jgi:excisionase family DNA binding protein